MSIELKPEIQEIIKSHVNTGIYTDADDVVIKALKLLAEWEKGYREWEEEVKKKVAVGLAQIERGDVVDAEVVMARLEEKIRKARENQT